jgi:hypothetical protein
MILQILGIILMVFGAVVSILFWIPAIFDRSKVQALLGERYRLVYLIYIANGPLLIVFGILLIIWQRV